VHVVTRYRGSVYLIHFDQPYKHAKHYMGWTRDLESRLTAHATGKGARLMEVIASAGIGWKLAEVWFDVDRNFERRLKRRGGASRICPICEVR
jgi:predicted GIY-YIG superfamily endonuclease